MYLIACGVVVGFIDHAGVYVLKLCPWCSLDLQDKMKHLSGGRCIRLHVALS